MITFVVEGEPIGKQRPRLGRGRVVYTPARTAAWENKIGWAARQAMGPQGPLTGDLRVQVEFRRSDARLVDIDNLLKSALDGGNGVVWHDDSQIIEIHATLVRQSAAPGMTLVVAGCG